MSRFHFTSRLALAAGLFCLAPGIARAQTAPQTNGGVLDLPEGISRVIAVDAHNILLAETDPEATNEPKKIVPLTVRHVYAGGIAKLFGGEVVPTEQFVSPAFNNANGNGGGNGFNNGGNNRRNNANPFGVGPTIGNPGFGNQGFGNQGFGNQGFGNQGFGNQGFGNGGYGFNGVR